MKKFLAEFKEFAIKGNIFDLAIGVIIGAAFNAIVKSLVDDILMPVIGMLIGGHDFSSLALQVGNAQIKYGMLIQNIVNFLITAMGLFVIVKVLAKLRDINSKKVTEEKEEEPEAKPDDVVLLEEIKDILSQIKDK